LENPDYPKVEPLKRKGGQDEGRDGPSKRPKVDYLAEDRVATKDLGYVNFALVRFNHLCLYVSELDFVLGLFVKSRLSANS
jgi:hypothetical protein